MTAFTRRHAQAIAWALTAAAVFTMGYLVIVRDVDIVDALLGLEVVVLVFVGLPLSIRGTALLIDAVRRSTVNDRLARAITAYLTLVTLTALYIVALQVWRALLAGGDLPEWIRPITGALTLLVLCGPAYVVRVAESGSGPRERDRSA